MIAYLWYRFSCTEKSSVSVFVLAVCSMARLHRERSSGREHWIVPRPERRPNNYETNLNATGWCQPNCQQNFKNTKKEKNRKQKVFSQGQKKPWCHFPTKTRLSMHPPSKNAILLWCRKRSVSNAVNYTRIQIYRVWLLFVATALQIKAEGRRGERTTQKRSETKAASIERPLIWRAQPQITSTFLELF